ncbi:hypothetical protein [Maricaulis salignorans]|uniref:Uncharacterized protein n=1 Tax=Maricaulis salignorans TaxID=144026 RepID=A0A1G9TLN5_9PROT|nr:hypothetical protein [Maricaulis salignorans]SDM48647.1 hypothetical protein SAMN04488568_11249 [Maricaulis salignorans]
MMAGVVAALALVAGPSAIASGGDALASADAPQPRMLSAAELQAYRTGRANTVPDNCWVETSPFTNQCIGVVCIEEGFWVLYECGEFGL